MADSGSTTRRSGHATFALRATARPQRHGRAIAKRRREDPGAAHAHQHKLASETEGATDFGGGLSSAQVGRVSPRPQDHRRSIGPLGPILRTLATVLGRTGCNYVLGPAVSERRALPARSPNSQLMLARVGSSPAAAGSGRPEICMSDQRATVQFTL